MIPVTLLLTSLLCDLPAQTVHFDTEVIPIFTKAGCNGGACHGAAAGRGGFRLSLLGGDPESDYQAIVQELEGRRINLAKPQSSLLIGKPTGMLDHEGGVPLAELRGGAERVAAWISAGAVRGPPRRLTHFEVSPARTVVAQLGTRVPLRAVARFDDGEPEDVTAWTVFTAADPAAVTIDADELVASVNRRGQHVVIARFLDRVVPLQWTLPLGDSPVELASQPRANFIDEEVLQALGILRLPVSPPVEDATFLRRLCLDLTGRLPTPEEVEAFLSDPAADKKAKLVDRLLSSDAFAEYWALRFARLLRMHSLPNDREGAQAYYQWLRVQIRDRARWDDVAQQLLTATGDSHSVGPANFSRMVGDARGHAELISHVFLGVRLQCANCHNHPLDRWTQDDYHGLAAVFARVDRGREVRIAERGAVTNLRTGEPAIPRIPGERYLDSHSDGRLEFAQWLTARDNRYFARATVNRLWQAMMGRGLIEPADDLRDTNPATHPELLERLATDFVQHGFNIRHTLQLLALSHTYGRSAESVVGNENDDRFYSRALRKKLEPEVLADAVADVTGIADEFADQPAGTRAVAIFDPLIPAPSLDVLGRCSKTVCEGNTVGGGLPGKLHLMNGSLINKKITDPKGRLHQWIAQGKSDLEIVNEFYLRALSRLPQPREQEFWRNCLAEVDPPARIPCLEDFVWSLLNCSEFSTNH